MAQLPLYSLPSRMGTETRSLLITVGLVATTLVFHAPALWGGFVYDDLNDVVRNPSAQASTFLDRLPDMVRPLLKASYAAQDALHGMNAAAFHSVNLGLHLVAVVLVFTLLDRASRMTGAVPPQSLTIAGLAALLWSLHPAMTETVSYVSGRSMGLSAVLILAALLAATGRKARPWLAFFCALLAPLARETALVAPLLLLIWQATVGQEETVRVRVTRAAPVWMGALLAAVVIMAMPRHRELVWFSLDQRGPLDALRANIFAVPEMFRLWLEPWRISILPSQPVSYGWTDPPTVLRLVGLLLIPGTALLWRKRAPLAAFALGWVIVALLPTNSLIWRVDPVALKPLYLAGIGLSVLVSIMLAKVRYGPWLAVMLALLLGVMTFSRAGLYRDEVALFADAAAKAPQDARAQGMHGLALANAGHVDEARRVLDQALELDPFLTWAENARHLLDAGAPIYTP